MADAQYRVVAGGKLQRGIPFLASLNEDPDRARAQLLRGIARSKDTWTHPQVAVRRLDLQGLGFEPTRLAIPLPGERVGATSWRAGELHAHKQGPVFLVHKDESAPGTVAGTLSHLAFDTPKAIVARMRTSSPVAKTAAVPIGLYKGELASPDTTKFKMDFQGIPINVDRPKGFVMLGKDALGTPWSRRYRYDYGHIPKTLGGDGDGLDVFLGPDKKAKHAYWAVQRKQDGSFDEYKVFLGFDSRDEAAAVYRKHIPKKLLAGLMTIRIEMMKAMLGKNPTEHIKVAALEALTSMLLRKGCHVV